jgi:hypothetical protein
VAAYGVDSKGFSFLEVRSLDGEPPSLPQALEAPAKRGQNPIAVAPFKDEVPKTPAPRKLLQFKSPISINVIAYSSDGKLIAVANGNPTIVMQANGKPKVIDNWRPAAEILDAETGKSIVTLKLTNAEEDAVLAAANRVSGFEVGALAFSPDDKVLAVGTSVGEVDPIFRTRRSVKLWEGKPKRR